MIINQALNGSTSLHLAVCRDSGLESIRLLLQHGADMEVVCNKSCTPVHLVIRCWDLCCLRAFIDAEFDTNIRAGIGVDFGRTILYEAIYVAAREGKEMIVYLFDHESKKEVINLQADNGLMPLHLAAGCGRFINLVDPLYGENEEKLTQRWESLAVKLLIQNNTNLRIKGNIGNSSAHIAAYRGDVSHMQPLKDSVLDFNNRGLCNRTILHAVVFGR